MPESLEAQVRELRRLREVKDDLARQADEAKLEYDRAHRALWERMDATGVHGIKVDGVQYVFNKPKVYGSISDKQEFIRWAEEHAPHLISPAPREGLINEHVRQCIDNNESVPPGVNWYVKEIVSQRKASA